jgi:Domain of unknown function (DUF1338)
MAASSALAGPHAQIEVKHPRDRFTTRFFDRLWADYRSKVSYVQMYEQVLRSAGGTFVNDHIAFRTFANQSPNSGIHTLGRLFEALGYQAAGAYMFPDKYLSALHFQHANPAFPKLFVSELQTWKLPQDARQLIESSVAGHRAVHDQDFLAALWNREGNESAAESALLDQLVAWFLELPWPTPSRAAVETINHLSQYAAWVLVHGYRVNHFTSLINSHGVEALSDIEKTSQALQRAGVPMKAEIEGEPGSALRQTATQAVTTPVPVMEADGHPGSMPWTYAYFELAQRDWQVDAAGRRVRFEGFLGSQATHLFEMTRLSGK